jgi:uncharacterized protein (DUF1800 family)
MMLNGVVQPIMGSIGASHGKHPCHTNDLGESMNWQSRLIAAAMAMFCISVAAAAELSEEQRALHVLNRLGYGPRPGDVEHVVAIGIDHYIELQLNPEKIRLPNELLDRLDTLTSQDMSTGDLLAEYVAANKAAKDGDEVAKDKRKETFKLIAEQTAEARLARAINSPAQLEEVMVDFWFNHFNVFEGKGQDRAYISSYERDAIRPYALGHFRDMLGATAKHPAMLFYLDNWLSVAPGFQAPGGGKNANANQQVNGLNENYAREVMELHTLGVDGGYTQRDVTELARMLTGWTFDPREMVKGGATFRFAPRRHDNGDKDWLGKHIGPRGQAEGEWALDILAAHPATAHHISYQLAQYFVSDVPPPALVDKLAKRFLDTQGDIREVLRTLFASPEFWNSAQQGSKFKTPYQYVVSSARATGMTVANIRPLLGILRQLGMPLYGCQTPDGYKNTEDAWLNPDALTRRINFATALASGKLPITRNPDDDTGMAVSKEQAVKVAQVQAVDAQLLLTTLGTSISTRTRETIEKNPPALQAAMVLGSPDFMRH